MKALRILIGVAILVALLGFGMQSAQAVGLFTYTTGFQVQNIDTTTAANVTILFYQPDGNQPPSSSISDSIPASGSKTYFPLTTVPNGFSGSVVVSSSTKVASVVNIEGTGGAQNVWAAYVGASAGSASLQLPLLMKNNSGYNTWFSVQNVGGSSTTITATYSDGTVASSPAAVLPGASYVFDQAGETHSAKVFSAVITSSGSVPLAAAVVEENPSTLFAYSGFNAGSNNVVFPLVNANNGGYQTGIQIQNIGASDTNVTVSYTPSSAGTACTETQTIAHGTSNTFALNPFAGVARAGITTDCVGGARFIGSAQVTTNSASMPLVGVVNQLKPGVNGEAYNAFDPASAAQTVVLPLIMDRNGGFFTGFSVMNVGTAAAVNCTFTGNKATSYTVSSASLPQFGALVDIENGKLAAGFVGSATCTAGSGGLLVAVVNELSTAAGDNLLVYEGIPVTP